MPGGPALQPEEVLLRRLPYDQHDARDAAPGFNAFHPNKRDVDGISLFREAEISAAVLGAGGSLGKQFWVARITVDAARSAGAELDPDDVPPGHVTVTNLHYNNRKEDSAQELKEKLRNGCVSVEGPFDGTVPRR